MKTIFRPLIAATLAVFLSLFVSISASADDDVNEVLRVYHVPRAEINQLRYYGDVWGLNWREDYVHIHVTPRGRKALEELGYTVETDREATARLEWFRNIDREAWTLSGVGGIPGFDCYRTVDETHDTYFQLEQDYPDYARVEQIGQSWQGDEIYALILANQSSPYEQAPLVIMAAQHARELTTAETAMRFAETLLQERETDGDIAWLLDHREIHIIAQQNPDGRRAVEQIDLNQRKNMNTNHCPGNIGGSFSQTGVDLNRNSTMLWGGINGYPDACSLQYRGTDPASEPETQTVQDYFDDVFERWWPPEANPPGGPGTPAVPEDARGIFISIHSYSEYVLFSWEGLAGGAANHSPNHNQLAYLGRKFGYHTGYRVEREFIYPAAGTMVDYAYGEFGVAGYTFELGTSFQQSCSYFENNIWPDVRDALLYAAKAAERPYQAASGPDVIDLAAPYNTGTGEVQITATVDGTRYNDGGAGEDPFTNPVFEIVEANASFGVPSHLAGATYPLTLGGSGSVVAVSGTVEPETSFMGVSTDRLSFGELYTTQSATKNFEVVNAEENFLFVTASDAGGYTGVPTAVWVDDLSPAGDLVLAAISPQGDSVFQITGGDCEVGTTLAPGQSCSVELGFSPDAEGEFVGSVVVQSVSGQEVMVALSGEGELPPPVLELNPGQFDFELAQGDSEDAVLIVGNTGDGTLEWDIETNTPEGAGTSRSHDPALDEVLDLEDFVSTFSGGPEIQTLPAGVATSGVVMGFSFEGTVSGISGNSTWASDLCMLVEAPDGSIYGVGGDSGTQPYCDVNDWDFQGGGSGSDGTYASAHDDVFDPAVPDEGAWTFTFYNDWNGAADMHWTDVSITLHKQPLPVCAEPSGVAWVAVDPANGVTAPGGSDEVTITANSAGLEPGEYEAYLCLTTNDPAASLVPVPVYLTVTEAVAGQLAVDPAALDFDKVTVGEAVTDSFTVSNAAPAGSLNFTLTAFEVSAGEAVFEITDSDCNLGQVMAPGDACTVEVTFAPGAVGAMNGEVLVGTDQGQSETVSLSGTGVQNPAELDVSPTSLDFGDVAVGSSIALSMTVSNLAAIGAADLGIQQIDVIAGGPEFEISGGDCGASLAPQESCTVELQFSPPAAGAYSGVLRVAADGETVNVNLSGSGIETVPTIFEDRFEDQ